MKFSEFNAQTSKQEKMPEGVAIGGSFGCQHCLEAVDEAEYFVMEKILRWKCPEGHVSFIEDFRL